MEINVLGTEYTVYLTPKSEDPRLEDNDGYTDTSEKLCVVDDLEHAEKDTFAKGDLKKYRKQVIRHELLHAFLFESGLDVNSWAYNEELVDWIAIQFPKIAQAFTEADCM